MYTNDTFDIEHLAFQVLEFKFVTVQKDITLFSH